MGTVRAAAARRRTCRSPASVDYRYGPDEVDDRAGPLRDRAHATSRSAARPPGATRSRLPFHVTSSDWQESDQLLAGIITDFGSPTGAGAVRRPRRVRRRDDRRRSARRASKGVQRRGSARLRHALGRRLARTSSSRTATSTSPTASSALGGLGDPRRRPVLARLSARRRRRGDQRADPRRAARPRQPAPRVRHRRLSGVRPAVRRVPPDRRATSGRSASAR